MSPPAAGCCHVTGFKVENWKQNLRAIYQCFVWSGSAETRKRKVPGAARIHPSSLPFPPLPASLPPRPTHCRLGEGTGPVPLQPSLLPSPRGRWARAPARGPGGREEEALGVSGMARGSIGMEEGTGPSGASLPATCPGGFSAVGLFRSAAASSSSSSRRFPGIPGGGEARGTGHVRPVAELCGAPRGRAPARGAARSTMAGSGSRRPGLRLARLGVFFL